MNKKLSEIFLQLHISEKSGRGVPRIVEEYGQEAFSFGDNAITVTIPFNRLSLEDTPSDTVPVTPSDDFVDATDTGRKILKFCETPKISREILDYLNLRDIKSLREQLKSFLFKVELHGQFLISQTVKTKDTSQ